MKMKTACICCLASAAIVVASSASAADQPVAASAPAKAAAAAPVFQKPAWMTDLSVAVRESYDDNLLLVSGAGPMKPDHSWVTTISPKIGVNFVPLLGDQTILQALTLSYAPDFVTYYNEPRVDSLYGSQGRYDTHESYNLHRLATTIKGKADAFSFNLDNAFNYVEGSKEAPVYQGNDSQRSAWATAHGSRETQPVTRIAPRSRSNTTRRSGLPASPRL